MGHKAQGGFTLHTIYCILFRSLHHHKDGTELGRECQTRLVTPLACVGTVGRGAVLYYSSSMYCNRQIKILKDLLNN